MIWWSLKGFVYNIYRLRRRGSYNSHFFRLFRYIAILILIGSRIRTFWGFWVLYLLAGIIFFYFYLLLQFAALNPSCWNLWSHTHNVSFFFFISSPIWIISALDNLLFWNTLIIFLRFHFRHRGSIFWRLMDKYVS